MSDDTLAAPVERLLKLGEPTYSREFAWPDYFQYGIGPEHISELIRVATNLELIRLPDELDPRGWGPVHAWRALGQLGAVEAIQPLLRLFHEVRDNDWVIEEMPDVFALIGPEAFASLASYLADEDRPAYSRLVAATSLMQMALAHPSVRDQAVAVLAGQLSGYRGNSPGVNGVLIANLIELEAVEQADLIHKVFVDGQVDRFIVGDWRDIRHRLADPHGNKYAPENGRQGNSLAKNISSVPPDPPARPARSDADPSTRRHPGQAR